MTRKRHLLLLEPLGGDQGRAALLLLRCRAERQISSEAVNITSR
jgi:hypothetical protein